MQLIISTSICQGSSGPVNVPPFMTLSVSPGLCPGPLRNSGAWPGNLEPLCHLSIIRTTFHVLVSTRFSQRYAPHAWGVSWYRMWHHLDLLEDLDPALLNLFRSNVQLLYFIKNLGWLRVSHCKPQQCNYLEEAEMCLGMWSPGADPETNFWEQVDYLEYNTRKSCERNGEVKLGKEETQQRV